MYGSFRQATLTIVSALALFVPLAGQVSAQTPSSVDPATLDVAGVKLGMTPDEAATALKQFDARFVIKKLYTQGQYSNYLIGGGDLTLFSEAERAKYYFTGLSAIDAGTIKPETICNPHSTTPGDCQIVDHDDIEKVTVGFSPVPGQERVIGITREKTFNKEPKPAIATLLAGVVAKYPYQPTFQHPVSGGSVVGWQFDARKQLMSGATAKNKRVIEVSGELPQRVAPGDGISLSARIVEATVGRVPNIAGNLYVSLVDSDALYKSIDQSKGAAAAARAKVDAATVEKAKGASPTKF
jgi:hypothetical protein